MRSGGTWTQGNPGNGTSIFRHAALLSKKSFGARSWRGGCGGVTRYFGVTGGTCGEVLESASRRGIDFGKLEIRIDKRVFQKCWIQARVCGSGGGKQEQDLAPPLAGFVERVVLPDADRMWGSTGGILFLPKNSSKNGTNRRFSSCVFARMNEKEEMVASSMMSWG